MAQQLLELAILAVVADCRLTSRLLAELADFDLATAALAFLVGDG